MRELRKLGYDFHMAVTSYVDITYKWDKSTAAFRCVYVYMVTRTPSVTLFSDITSPTVLAVKMKLMIAILVQILRYGKTWRTHTFDAKGVFLQTCVEGCS